MDRYLLIRASGLSGSATMGDQEFISRLFESHSVDAMALALLLLASKFDEIDDNIPLIEEFCKAHTLVRDSIERGFIKTLEKDVERLGHNRGYPGFHALQRCEVYLLGVLEWDLNRVTPLHFVQNYLH